jgi:hypothetical protein
VGRIEKRLSPELQAKFRELRFIYKEIQNRLKSGEQTYADLHSKAKTLIEKYIADGEVPEQLFAVLKPRSYEILSFLQDALLYEQPYPEALRKIDGVKDKLLIVWSKIFEPLMKSLSEIEQVKEILDHEYPDQLSRLKDVFNNLSKYLVQEPKILNQLQECIFLAGVLQKIEAAQGKLMAYKHPDHESSKLLTEIHGLLKGYDPNSKLLGEVEEAIEILSESQNYELETLMKIEEARIKAFRRMCDLLKLVQPVGGEEKKESDPPVRKKKARKLTEEEQKALNEQKKLEEKNEIEEQRAIDQIFFNGGALQHVPRQNQADSGEPSTVTHSDLIFIWAGEKNRWREVEQKLFGKQSLRQLFKENLDPINQYSNVSGDSYSEFLINCSLRDVQNNLRVHFSPSLLEFFRDKFKDESFRSDFCYFTAQKQFCDMDFQKFNRPSSHYLRRAQEFLQLVQKNWIDEKYRAEIFEMILHRSENEKWDSFAGLSAVLEGLNGLLNAIPDPKKENFRQNPLSWSLLVFLLNQRESEKICLFFIYFAKDPQFTISLAMIHAFCKKHKHEWTKEWIEYLYGANLAIMETLAKWGVKTKNGESFLFNPPIEETTGTTAKLKHYEDNCIEFLEKMRPYRLPADENYFAMLRRYVHTPSSEIFKRLGECRWLLGHPSTDLFLTALTGHHPGLEKADWLYYKGCAMPPKQEKWFFDAHAAIEQEIEIPNDENDIKITVKEKALEITKNIQRGYHFSDVQVFLIYLEIIRVISRNQEREISRIQAGVAALEEFCGGGLDKTALHFLYLHGVHITEQQVTKLYKLRSEWAQLKYMGYYVIPKPEVLRVQKECLAIIDEILVPYQQLGDTSAVRDMMMDNVWNTILPNTQYLSDGSSIINVRKYGADWAQDAFISHDGQIFFIKKNSNSWIGMYLRWDLMADQPTLFVTCIDVRNMRAVSGYVSIPISAEEFSGNDARRKAFYTFLFSMRGFLHEDLEAASRDKTHIPDPKLEYSSSEDPDELIDRYHGMRDLLTQLHNAPENQQITIQDVHILLKFYGEVKILNRKLFRDIFRAIPNEIPLDDREKIAALGHIFSDTGRAALLPKSILSVAGNPECYLPDASEEFARNCWKTFARSTPSFRDLKLNLHIEGKKPFPISYRAQPVDELTGTKLRKIRKGSWNEKAAPYELLGGKFVMLSVDVGKRPLIVRLRYPEEVLKTPNRFLYEYLLKVLGEYQNPLRAYEKTRTELLHAKLSQFLGPERAEFLEKFKKIHAHEYQNAVLYEELCIALEEESVKKFENFEWQNAKILQSCDEENLDLLYGKFSEVLGKEKTKFLEDFKADRVNEYKNALLYEKLCGVLGEEAAKLLDEFELKNREFLESDGEMATNLLFMRLSGVLGKECEKILEDFKKDNINKTKNTLLYEKLCEVLREQAVKILDGFLEVNGGLVVEYEGLLDLDSTELFYKKFAEILGMKMNGFIEQFRKESAPLIKAYEEKRAKECQVLFDLHNLELKWRTILHFLKEASPPPTRESSEFSRREEGKTDT